MEIFSFQRLFEFFLDHGILKNRKTYSQNIYLKLSVNAENTTDDPAARDPERVDEKIIRILPHLME